MSYQVVKTKAGFAVQNTKTYAIVNVYSSELDAMRICKNLNTKVSNNIVVYVVAA